MNHSEREFLAEALPPDVARAIRRLRRTAGVYGVAVMPDVHLSEDVCVGVVTATHDLLLPDAVGGDIGCGMTGIRLTEEPLSLGSSAALEILTALQRRVPIRKHATKRDLPSSLETELSDPALDRALSRDGRVQLGTLGRGNHFVELQRDEAGALFAMIHSGSRSLGRVIRAHHRERANVTKTGIRALSADSDEGRAYLHDVAFARRYAQHNRDLIAGELTEIIRDTLQIDVDTPDRISSDHNHVQQETHDALSLYVHRKGAQSAAQGERGVIPGSMGTASYHVVGRAHAPSFCSASHGAGRALSRSAARRVVTRERFQEDTKTVFFDRRIAHRLREEAPAAYKDIRKVIRAQRKLVRVSRVLHPILSFKGA